MGANSVSGSSGPYIPSDESGGAQPSGATTPNETETVSKTQDAAAQVFTETELVFNEESGQFMAKEVRYAYSDPNDSSYSSDDSNRSSGDGVPLGQIAAGVFGWVGGLFGGKSEPRSEDSQAVSASVPREEAEGTEEKKGRHKAIDLSVAVRRFLQSEDQIATEGLPEESLIFNALEKHVKETGENGLQYTEVSDIDKQRISEPSLNVGGQIANAIEERGKEWVKGLEEKLANPDYEPAEGVDAFSGQQMKDGGYSHEDLPKETINEGMQIVGNAASVFIPGTALPRAAVVLATAAKVYLGASRAQKTAVVIEQAFATSISVSPLTTFAVKTGQSYATDKLLNKIFPVAESTDPKKDPKKEATQVAADLLVYRAESVRHFKDILIQNAKYGKSLKEAADLKRDMLNEQLLNETDKKIILKNLPSNPTSRDKERHESYKKLVEKIAYYDRISVRADEFIVHQRQFLEIVNGLGEKTGEEALAELASRYANQDIVKDWAKFTGFMAGSLSKETGFLWKSVAIVAQNFISAGAGDYMSKRVKSGQKEVVNDFLKTSKKGTQISDEKLKSSIEKVIEDKGFERDLIEKLSKNAPALESGTKAELLNVPVNIVLGFLGSYTKEIVSSVSKELGMQNVDDNKFHKFVTDLVVGLGVKALKKTLEPRIKRMSGEELNILQDVAFHRDIQDLASPLKKLESIANMEKVITKELKEVLLDNKFSGEAIGKSAGVIERASDKLTANVEKHNTKSGEAREKIEKIIEKQMASLEALKQIEPKETV